MSIVLAKSSRVCTTQNVITAADAVDIYCYIRNKNNSLVSTKKPYRFATSEFVKLFDVSDTTRDEVNRSIARAIKYLLRKGLIVDPFNKSEYRCVAVDFTSRGVSVIAQLVAQHLRHQNYPLFDEWTLSQCMEGFCMWIHSLHRFANELLHHYVQFAVHENKCDFLVSAGHAAVVVSSKSKVYRLTLQ